MSTSQLSHDEVLSRSSLFPDLLRLAGGYGNISGGGIYMARVLISGVVHALSFGLTGAAVSATIFGTSALPFLVASCAGFTFGAVGFHMDCLRRGKVALGKYEGLLCRHLEWAFPSVGYGRWETGRLTREIRERRGGWVAESRLIAAWLMAQPALQTIYEKNEERYIEAAITAAASAENAAGQTRQTTIDAASADDGSLVHAL